MTVFNDNLKLIITERGKSIVSKVDLTANKIIYEFTGDIFEKDKLVHSLNDCIQITNKLFIGPSGGLDDYIRHSCNPNCGLYISGNRAFLKTIAVIKKDSEINFDYSTCSNDSIDTWQLNCNCGNFNCRKIISGFQYLPEDLKLKYSKLGIVPKFIKG